MSIEKIEWENADYGSHPEALKVSFTSRTKYTDGSHEDLRFRIDFCGVGYNISSCPVVEEQPGRKYSSRHSEVMLTAEHWRGTIGLSTHNLRDLAYVLDEYSSRLSSMCHLRRGSAIDQLSRTLE